jgi:DNA (cytosine-5)-methyltransferase 1
MGSDGRILFAGPGGLGEGFASVRDSRGRPVFRISLSIEMDEAAHSTLQLRHFFREFEQAPPAYYQHLRRANSRQDLFNSFPEQARNSCQRSWCAELGKVSESDVDLRIVDALGNRDEWVLCGGPPCQAYSVVGRSRKGGIDQSDDRLYLYRQYLRILARHRPPVFIIENVKGLLSSKVKGNHIFEDMLADLQEPERNLLSRRKGRVRYRIHPLVTSGATSDFTFRHKDFVIRSEDFGVPQCRHRVILMGVREDVASLSGDVSTLMPIKERIPVSAVLAGLPAIRSGISRAVDSIENWREAIARSTRSLNSVFNSDPELKLVSQTMHAALTCVGQSSLGRGDEFIAWRPQVEYRPDWYLDPKVGGICNHVSRPHMEPDLHRYFFAACYARAFHRSPELRDYPTCLLPEHKNVREPGKENYFDDRFRVQLADQPALTVTCHMAKDGHYYIHPDPTQCRSLTVREAARIQTFPDNYLFSGTRTAQYRQVGNAVPPLLACQIAEIVAKSLGLAV